MPFYQKPNNTYASTPTPAITYESSNYTVHCSINDTWESHKKIHVTINNTSNSTINNWSIAFKSSGEITEIWDAKICAHVNDLYVISNATYNQDISANDSVSFEFITFYEYPFDLPSEFILPLKEVTVPTSNYSVTLVENASWDKNYTGEIIISNLSEETITDWNLTIEFDTNLHHIWNATITSKQYNIYTLENLNYNQNISPGESISIGFLGTSNGNKSIIEHKLTEYTTAEVLNNLVIKTDFEGLIPITDNYYISPLYSLDNEVSAYQIQYLDEIGQDCSYIIVNNAKHSKDTYYIEFGYGSPSIISKLESLYYEKSKKSDYKILYLGGTNYYLQDESTLYTLSENVLCKVSSFETPLPISYDTNTYYDYRDTLTYQEIVSIEVGITEFTPVGHCAPTTATNLFIYLSLKEYPSLDVTRNNYQKTFTELYKAMGTSSKTEGTNYKKVAIGIENVLRNRGLANASVSIHEDVNWYDAISCIDNRPVYLSLKESEIYSNHGVLGVGYISFTHSTGWVSKYFQIADAWESTYHYVNYSLGIDEIRLLEVTFGGK